ncbi:MAG: hypothetical protein LBE04_02575 [Prevotellaceae bacterium]|jgi:hypothetical protein|nr:hypothetical protein [Prevotellaceae bacterium]
MVKILKMFIVCMFGSLFMTSCLKNNELRVYAELYSVIKSSAGTTYFSSDEELDLYLENGSFDPKWGNVGDRVLVGFFYNPTTIAENDTKVNITLENLTSIRTVSSALLPTAADSVGSGTFVYDNNSSQSGIIAWAAQNYLTAIFFVRYTDATKHSFGFIEEPELFHNDTLFFTMWHNAKDDSKTRTSKSHLALDLSGYDNYLSARDSTVISIKYNVENQSSSGTEKYTYNVMYRKRYNTR